MKVYPIFNKEKQTQVELYLKKHNKRNYLLFVLGCHTGLRISDILKIKVCDIKNNKLTIKEQKTGKINNVVISSKLSNIIKEFVKDNNLQDDEILFKSRQSKNFSMSIRRVQQIIKQIAKIIGISENINSHSMRKTFAYNLYRLSGNNIALVMEALNHSRESTTLKYLCIKELLLTDIVEYF